MNISSFLIGYQAGKKAGGGSSADVRYVTFMSDDGTEELGKIPVATGYDCPNPKFTPTKESTAQFHFTHDYWATEPNGATDLNALKAVTEDRVVYATYISALRYYTITYYDEDGTTALKTESLAYGSTPSYTPEKDGYSFTGWNPAIATVTAAASYYAQWVERITFAGGSWSDIAEIAESGKASEYFAVGDTRTIGFNGETITLAVAGFDHDDLADGSGKAGMSIVCMTVPSRTQTWGTGDRYYFSGASAYCSLLAKELDSTFFSYLPEELQAVIKSVKKSYDTSLSSGTGTSVTSSNFKLWALSIDELGYTTGDTVFSSLGNRYALFPYTPANTGDKFPAVTIGTTGENAEYWTRHQWRVGVCNPVYVKTQINSNAYGVKNLQGSSLGTNGKYVRFGFCI